MPLVADIPPIYFQFTAYPTFINGLASVLLTQWASELIISDNINTSTTPMWCLFTYSICPTLLIQMTWSFNHSITFSEILRLNFAHFQQSCYDYDEYYQHWNLIISQFYLVDLNRNRNRKHLVRKSHKIGSLFNFGDDHEFWISHFHGNLLTQNSYPPVWCFLFFFLFLWYAN